MKCGVAINYERVLYPKIWMVSYMKTNSMREIYIIGDSLRSIYNQRTNTKDKAT